jgi:hypothetical protein
VLSHVDQLQITAVLGDVTIGEILPQLVPLNEPFSTNWQLEEGHEALWVTI